MDLKKIVVIGAGPAGMMAAIRASELGQHVTLIERNSYPGRKFLLTGKGRSNLTNAAEPDLFRKRFLHGGEFLRDAFRKFSNLDLISFFEERNLKLIIERQARVFPAGGKSADLLGVLMKQMLRNKVKIMLNSRVTGLVIEKGSLKGVVLENNIEIPAQNAIVATGGVSYAFTGSTGDGLRFAKNSGHRVVEQRPGLVPLVTKGKNHSLMQGLTLKNIRIKFVSLSSTGGQKKQIISETGELMFTHLGLSGPLVLSLSGRISEWLSEKRKVFAEIDLKPALSETQLDARLLREFSANSKKNLRNTLKELLPLKMVDVFLHELKIDPGKQASHVTQEERHAILRLLKAFRFDISGTLPIEEAMVTMGGVSLKDINPRTMESRIIKGLYFAGEVIDVDADTGGFNLQSAFSTGYLAGESAALS